MESERIQQELSTFLAAHSLESNVDEVVLSYIHGLFGLLSETDTEECFEIEDVMEMMNAYLPGFDEIDRKLVIDWISQLSEKLLKTDDNACEESKQLTQKENESFSVSTDTQLQEENGLNAPNFSVESNNSSKDTECDPCMKMKQKKSSFPTYNFKTSDDSNKTSDKALFYNDQQTIDSTVPYSNRRVSELPEQKSIDQNVYFLKNSSLISTCSSKQSEKLDAETFSSQKAKSSSQKPNISNDKQIHLFNTNINQSKKSKKKSRFNSSSQNLGYSYKPKNESFVEDENQVKLLLEMFPTSCTVEARHCLQLSNNDIDQAAQLLMDRQDGCSSNQKTKAKIEYNTTKKKEAYKLADDTIKSTVLQKYSFVDTQEDKKTYNPPPLKAEAKKLVRYRDGQIVSTKGERFSEIKKKETEEMKNTYVNLKPARKYRFH